MPLSSVQPLLASAARAARKLEDLGDPLPTAVSLR